MRQRCEEGDEGRQVNGGGEGGERGGERLRNRLRKKMLHKGKQRAGCGRRGMETWWSLS